MAENSKIQWTDASWNPTVGCSVTSPGCTNCYAMRMAGRLEAMGNPIYRGHTVKTKAGHVWNGIVAASNHGQMIKPLSWKKPRRIFVNSMSDLFHEDMPDDVIDQVFGVMALCPQHSFQVLTKRSARMRAYFDALSFNGHYLQRPGWQAPDKRDGSNLLLLKPGGWPLPNVWLGVSVEDKERLVRIDDLRATPAAVRFLSLEPLLEFLGLIDLTGIDQCIIGGESGHRARVFDLAWARDILGQCRAADVACFVKQLGAKPWSQPDKIAHRNCKLPLAHGYNRFLNDSHGGNPEEWPEDLRVREFPGAHKAIPA